MGEVVDLVSNALRRKLLDYGARSLSEAEWHLLRVSHLLNALDDGTLERLLADSPLAELLALADGLDAIAQPDAARSLRWATTELAAANDPGNGMKRAETVTATTSVLTHRLSRSRSTVEEHLLDYAFRLRELQPETQPA
jgi:hypothetical protein